MESSNKISSVPPQNSHIFMNTPINKDKIAISTIKINDIDCDDCSKIPKDDFVYIGPQSRGTFYFLTDTTYYNRTC